MKKLRAFLALCLMLAVVVPVQAEFIGPSGNIPIERLLASLNEELKTTDKPAELHGELGRAYSLAFAMGQKDVDILGKDHVRLYEECSNLPGELNSVRGEVSDERFGYLAQAIEHYKLAVDLEPKSPVYQLGYAYTSKKAAIFASRMLQATGKSTGDDGVEKARKAYEDASIAAYRTAFALTKDGGGSGVCTPISVEAGREIVNYLQAKENRTPEEARELKVVKRKTIDLGNGPHAVTPIIFSLSADKPLEGLLARDKTVSFDLDGLGARAWPWVKPDTAILVWDPGNEGKITSGIQMIGSVTWWLFWKNGYDVLRALDDNRDGWLAGAELRGLALWTDRNSNGVSDAGEVHGVADCGIARLAVHKAGEVGGMPFNPKGLQRADGRFLPTYDWIATSKH